jgi:hypothetical protein
VCVTRMMRMNAMLDGPVVEDGGNDDRAKWSMGIWNP